MAMKPWLLTTPASRGIGFQLARRLLKTTDLPVVATARQNIEETKSQILKDLDVDSTRLSVFELDTKPPSPQPSPTSPTSSPRKPITSTSPSSSPASSPPPPSVPPPKSPPKPPSPPSP
ncbi:hypothetical protein Q9189_004288 [Teloschistes chrysophthalmus]